MSRESSEKWRLPPDIDISDWADKYYYLSTENSSTPGKWTTHPYQREPMNIIKNTAHRRITFKKSSRVGFTKSCINIPMGYFMHMDPRSMGVLLPRGASAEKHSKVELTPMLRDCPVLSGMVFEGSRQSNNTILEKHYPGGVIHIGDVNSSRMFRQITFSIAFCDETSDYALSSGGEGNWLKLVNRRMGDAWNRLLVEGSTPKIKGACSISDSFEQSDQRRYKVPCPHCDHGQFLEWGGKEKDFGIKWESGKPETAYYLCEHCHCPIDHREKRWMVAQGDYEVTNPEGGWPGFHIWAAYSFQPDADWGLLAKEFLECGNDPLKLQVFENTIKGEAFEPRGEAPNEMNLMRRREPYPQRNTGRVGVDNEPELETMVPKGAVYLTCGTDLQPDRIESQVFGWGAGEEVWTCEYSVLYGDPSAKAIWDEYFDWLRRPRWIERGGVDYIRSTCVDSGYAAHTVYGFVAPRSQYRLKDGKVGYLWAVKGSHGDGKFWPRAPSQPDAKTKIPLYTLKVDAGKQVIYRRLQGIQEPGPGFIHFSLDRTDEYFRGLTSEHYFPRIDARGFSKNVWEKKKGRERNEPLDTFVYGYAALEGAYQMGLDLPALAQSPRPLIPHPDPVGDPYGGHVPPEVAKVAREAAERQRARRPRVSRSNYLR